MSRRRAIFDPHVGFQRLTNAQLHQRPTSPETAAAAAYAGCCGYDHQGRRVVEGQRLIQAAGDIFLGWTSGAIDGVEYYVRQLWDMKGRVDTQLMHEESLALFAELCGRALARAHARSGTRWLFTDTSGRTTHSTTPLPSLLSPTRTRPNGIISGCVSQSKRVSCLGPRQPELPG